MKYVLVDTISTFRIRYAVAVPDNLTDDEALTWAKDSVTCEEVEEFSQYHIGESISDASILSKESLLSQFDKDNEYFTNWPEDKKLQYVKVING
jgi:hypothetical protein